ncbi:Short palate, lung and nasal epithelium carcinoma-associated protein 2 [Fukomys damarensis]|uniref:Short palate, lung and nasal epithelium carcinoma-associated protein 2 n=1 Tax=Fukomys damarensis TaxID=885580 RepID=A0A091DLV7_FUKDA|nr:Short palate, lung and nasal epithelium carcinoma-associated protein 2 [Fukomys damarensis]
MGILLPGFLNLNSRVPQNFIAKKKIPRTKKVVDLALPYVHPSLENIFGVKISKTVIRDIQAEWAADGRSINLRFLVTANVTATLSLVCKRVNLEVFLDLLTRIGLVPVPQTSLFTVVVGEFTADPASIKVSLLDRANDTINKAMNSTNGVLKMVFSALLQKQLDFNMQLPCKSPSEEDG